MSLPGRRKVEAPAGLSEEDRALFAAHERGGQFFNPWGQTPQPGALEILKWKLGKNPFAEEKRLQEPPEVIRGGLEKLAVHDGPGLIWIGHASFLIELDGLRLLVDPIFGAAGTLVRRMVAPPFEVEDLPPIDAVLITHGHYDHLDRSALTGLGRRFGEKMVVVAPLGLEKSIHGSCERVMEVDWWEVIDFGGVEIFFVPAQHWHRRGLADYNRALWGGYVIRGTKTIYHAGDTGYFGGFRTFRRVFGEIDEAILPVGAYEPRWFMSPQHMAPEESLRAFEELGAKRFVGMHWGTFDLTDEPAGAGPRRLQQLVAKGGLEKERFQLPLPGECLGF